MHNRLTLLDHIATAVLFSVGRIWKKQVKDKRFSVENEKVMDNEVYLM